MEDISHYHLYQGQIPWRFHPFWREILSWLLHRHKQVEESSCFSRAHTPALWTPDMKHFVRNCKRVMGKTLYKDLIVEERGVGTLWGWDRVARKVIGTRKKREKFCIITAYMLYFAIAKITNSSTPPPLAPPPATKFFIIIIINMHNTLQQKNHQPPTPSQVSCRRPSVLETGSPLVQPLYTMHSTQ